MSKSGYFTCVKPNGIKYIWTGPLTETKFIGNKAVQVQVIVGDRIVEEDAKRYKTVRTMMDKLADSKKLEIAKNKEIDPRNVNLPRGFYASLWKQAMEDVTGVKCITDSMHFAD